MQTPADPVSAMYDTWMSDLIDLTSDNPLLYFHRDRHAVRLLNPASDILHHLTSSTAVPELFLRKQPDGGETSSVQVASSKGTVPVMLRSIMQRANLIRDEQGAHVLYLTFGTLRWSAASEPEIESPIFLLAVNLHRPHLSLDYVVTPLDANPELQINPALAFRVRRDTGIELHSLLVPENQTVDQLIEAVRHIIPHQLTWTVDAGMHLALLPFGKYAMYQDLEHNRTDFLRHPAIREIAGFPEPVAESAVQPVQIVDPAWQVLDADQSQRAAICKIASSVQSLVIQGPPGTGKSQTITNIIAEFLGRGKRVLFVSAKRSALQVLTQRLDQVGLGEFCLALHDDQRDNASLIQILSDRSGMQAPDPGSPITVSAATLEEESRELAIMRQHLARYFTALCADPTSLQKSTYDIIGEYSHLDHIPLTDFSYDPDAIGNLTPHRREEFERTIDDLVRVAHTLISPESNPWRNIDATLASAEPTTRYRLTERLEALQVQASILLDTATRIASSRSLPPQPSLADAEWLEDVLGDLASRPAPTIPKTWFARATHERIRKFLQQQQANTGIQSIQNQLLQRYTRELLDTPDLVTQLRQHVLGDKPGALVIDPVFTPGPHEDLPSSQIPVRIALALVATSIDRLLAARNAIVRRFDLHQPETLTDMTRLHDVVSLVLDGSLPGIAWFDPDRIAELRELAAMAEFHASAQAERPVLLGDFRPTILDEATDEHIEQLSEPTAGFWAWIRDVARWDIGRVEDHLIGGESLSREEATAWLELARDIRLADTWFAGNDPALQAFAHHGPLATLDWEHQLRILETAEHGRMFVDIANPPASLFHPDTEIPPATDLLQELRHCIAQLESAIALLEDVAPALQEWCTNLLHQPLEPLARQLRTTWLAGFDDILQSFGQFVGTRRIPWTTYAELIADIRQAADVQQTGSELIALLDGWYRGSSTDWHLIDVCLNWIEALRQRFHDGTPPQAFIDRLATANLYATEQRDELNVAIERYEDAADAVAPFFTSSPLSDEAVARTLSLVGVDQWVRLLLGNLPALDQWFGARDVRQRAELLGITPFLDAVLVNQQPPELWPGIFDRQVLTLWLTWRLDQVPQLASLMQINPERIVQRFAELDRRALESTSHRLVDQLHRQRIATRQQPSLQSEMAALRRAAASGQQGGLRQIFHDALHLVQVLAPCMLMSPSAVAELLGNRNIVFDVVIFDEASQLVPEEAIGAIGRARQMVVVGDSQQLPPTNFFGSSRPRETWKPESLLDACTTAGLPNTWLQWHYRSRHEDLIAYANRTFYKGRLITFPSPDSGADHVHHHLVADGVYDRGETQTNPVEARHIVDLLVEHVRSGEAESLGIISFSEAQMEIIEEEIEQRRIGDPQLDDFLSRDTTEPVFVRNLESVQGDERDVILISVGYGPDAKGNMARQFGPVNREGGERRLNVAITRARKKLIIATSFEPERLRDAPSAGIRVLYEFLMYARLDPAQPKTAADPDTASNQDFPSAVANALRQRGLVVEQNIGSGRSRVDIGIRANASASRFLLGIECDGSLYPLAPDARDRDRLRQQVLEGLGWRIHRVWSMAWLNDREQQIETILDLVREQMALSPADAPTAGTPASPPENIATPSASSPVTNIATPAPAVTTPLPDRDIDDSPESPGIGVVWPATPFPAESPVSPIPEPFDPALFSPAAVPITPAADEEPTAVPAPVPKPVQEAAPPRAKPEEAKPTSAPKPRRSRKPEAAPAPPTIPSGRKRDTAITSIQGLTAEADLHMEHEGIQTLGDLLAATETQKGLRDLAKRINVTTDVLRDWRNRADLMQIPGIGAQYADLLERSEVASRSELGQRNPENLHKTLKNTKRSKSYKGRIPTLNLVRQWISEARQS